MNGIALSDCIADGSITTIKETIYVKGEMVEQVDINDSFPLGEKTGFFIPLTLAAKDGDILSMLTLSGNSKSLTFGATGDPADTMVLVMAVDKEATDKVRKLTLTRGGESTEYTVDYSGVIFPV